MDIHTRQARRKRLRALHEKGLSASEIALVLRISRQRVHQLRRALGLTVPSQTQAAHARRALIKPLIRAGHPPHVILARLPDLTHDQLYRDARALGLYDRLRKAWSEALAKRHKAGH